MRPSGVLNLGARMTVFTVTSQTQLDSALAILKSGDTVQLGAGAYSFVLSSKPFTSNVTITSLDPANPARLSWLKLTDTPPAWGDKLLQVDVYAWDEQAKAWEPKMEEEERARQVRLWKKAVTKTFDWIDEDVSHG